MLSVCGSIGESLMHTAIFVDLDATIPSNASEYRPSASRVLWTKKHYLGAECKKTLADRHRSPKTEQRCLTVCGSCQHERHSETIGINCAVLDRRKRSDMRCAVSMLTAMNDFEP